MCYRRVTCAHPALRSARRPIRVYPGRVPEYDFPPAIRSLPRSNDGNSAGDQRCCGIVRRSSGRIVMIEPLSMTKVWPSVRNTFAPHAHAAQATARISAPMKSRSSRRRSSRPTIASSETRTLEARLRPGLHQSVERDRVGSPHSPCRRKQIAPMAGPSMGVP